MTSRAERPLKGEDEDKFFRVVRAAFGQRRKTLVNALHSTFGNTYSKATIEQLVENCGFDVRIRGEKLSIEEFKRISACIK
jgi:16S rRNA (adenine1518-N6/adenine1519-N6)-dimethyltransferase